jgi:formamidopyrimidine-DNA glycosylase
MPELPEVECLTRAVRHVLEGRSFEQALFFRSDLRWPIPIQDFQERLVGVPIRSVHRRSKYLILSTERGHGIFHLGMSGNILLSTQADSPWKHTHASFTIGGADEARYLHFVDPRRFGCILTCSGEELAGHPLIRNLGPEPLETGDLALHLAKRSQRRTVAIKNFLMDAHNVVGVGNIYANESLFRAAVRPTRKASSLKMAEWEALAQAVREVLSEAIQAGGTSFRDYKHVDGEPGYFELALQVYGRDDEACLRCASPVQLAKIGGRASYFCRKCQR